MFLNKAFIYGNLTKDPELKTLPSGQSVINFSIATNRTWKNKNGEKQNSAEFHNMVAFGRTADLIKEYMRKGGGLFVEGRLQTRTWESKNGEKHYKTEIIVENMQFGFQKANNDMKNDIKRDRNDINEEQVDNDSNRDSSQIEEINTEDIPF